VDKARQKELGAVDMFPPVKTSCEDHEGSGAVKVQQWDGKKWNAISDWLSGTNDFSKPLVQSSAETLAKEMGRAPRDCTTGN